VVVFSFKIREKVDESKAEWKSKSFETKTKLCAKEEEEEKLTSWWGSDLDSFFKIEFLLLEVLRD